MAAVSIYPILLKHRVDKLGRSAIAIRIVRGGKVISTRTIGHKVSANHWDENARKVKSSAPNYSMLNSIINSKVSEYEGELMKKQLLGSSLSNTSIKKMANGINPNQDYIQFCKEIIPVKYPKPTQSETRRQHLSELSKLEQFRSPVYFSDLNHQFLTEYRAWMINERGNTDNTVWKSLKAMYAMTNEALKVGGYLAESPFKNFDRGRYQQGRRKFLNVEDCVKLEAKLQEQGINERLRLVGYYFLFMCYAGFRFQDAIKQFDYDKHVIDGERIVLKTGKFGVDVDILIHNRLASVLEFIRHNPLTEAEYTFNRNLKDLQKLAGIDVDLTAHVGRHTFGTMLAELDVPIEKAQMLLGHRDLESTKIYYHIKNKSLDKEMEKFNKFSNLKL